MSSAYRSASMRTPARASSLGDVRRILALAEGVELPTEVRAEVINSDDAGQNCPYAEVGFSPRTTHV
jgi:hypothetical protein